VFYKTFININNSVIFGGYMKTPCEVVVKYVLPEVRALVAKVLGTKYNLTQQEIAQKLGITQAAVSYYLSNKRAKKLEEVQKIPEVVDLVDEYIKQIMNGEINDSTTFVQFCQLCKTIKSKGLLCEISKKLGISIDETFWCADVARS